MSCPRCGAKIGTQDRFCTACGKNLISLGENLTGGQKETEFFSFGPFGVNVCFSRPGIFVWMQKNNTKIVVTNRRIYGSGSSIFGAGSLRFEVPYNAIIGKETFNYILWKVLWIQYREAEKTKEVSIMGNPPNYQHIKYAYNLLQEANV